MWFDDNDNEIDNQFIPSNPVISPTTQPGHRDAHLECNLRGGESRTAFFCGVCVKYSCTNFRKYSGVRYCVLLY